MELRIALVDDSARFLRTARAVLEAGGLEVVGTASNRADGRRLVEETRPDVLLVDVQLGDDNGAELAADLAGRSDRPAVILMSAHDRADLADLDGMGLADGFIPKARLSGQAVRELVAGVNRP